MERKGARRNQVAAKRKKRVTPSEAFAAEFLRLAERTLAKQYLPRILSCLRELGDEGCWRRSNPASNSAGNLVLHLAGNMHQWITSGLGRAPDIRNRSAEFSETGPIGSALLAALLTKEVRDARRVLRNLTAADLRARYTIQQYPRVTGMAAIQRVTEHVAYHAGQIIYITKSYLGRDMGFTRLPGEARARQQAAAR